MHSWDICMHTHTHTRLLYTQTQPKRTSPKVALTLPTWHVLSYSCFIALRVDFVSTRERKNGSPRSEHGHAGARLAPETPELEHSVRAYFIMGEPAQGTQHPRPYYCPQSPHFCSRAEDYYAPPHSVPLGQVSYGKMVLALF